MKQPCQRDVGRLGAELAAERLIGLELTADRLHPLQQVNRGTCIVCRLERAGQEPSVQRAVGDQADAQAPQSRHQLHLDTPLGQVVEALLGGEPEEVPGIGGRLGQGDVPGGEVAAAHVGHLALADQLFHGLPDLFPRCRSVDMVHLVQVDVVCL